jgi:hypothetical protein
MNTINKDSLKDFTALATGGKLKYTFTLSNHWKVGAAVYTTVNFGLQDLRIPDPTTGRLSRYEEGLFNRLDLDNDVVMLLGEFYVSFKNGNHTAQLGRMKRNTPLINPQDGRMIPTLVQGLWYTYERGILKRFQFGLLNELAPRSTGRFYGIGESIGTYPMGRNVQGQPSNYFGNTHSDFILLWNTKVALLKNVQVDLWNYYVNNIYNTVYLKTSYRAASKLTIQGEWLHQNKIGNGGNETPELQYFQQANSDIVGVQFQYEFEKGFISLGYDHILPNGMFISPREWGRENLFSFQKRERSEGTSNNHALVFNYKNVLPISREHLDVTTLISVGKHWKPSVLDTMANKYAVPNYIHMNMDFFLDLKKVKKLRPELLFTAKLAQGSFPDNANFYYNKVDLLHVDFILNYTF